MNERTMRDRFHALGPLVLRIGIALVLLQDGLQRVDGLFGQAAEPVMEFDRPALVQAAFATPEGLHINADWASVLGAGELAASGMLFLGLLTRLVAAPILGVVGYGLVEGFSQTSMPGNSTAMLLLGVASLSLLCSGAGCFALRRPRRTVYVAEMPAVRERRAEREDYGYEPRAEPAGYRRGRRSPARKVREWFGRLRRPRRPTPAAVAVPRRRWPWKK